MMEKDSRIVLRYNSEGHCIQRLPLHTVLSLAPFVKWYNEISRQGLVERLNTGHSCPLPDGGWIEVESRHV